MKQTAAWSMLAVACATGCANGTLSAQPVTVKALYRSTQCGVDHAEARASHIPDAVSFARVIERLRRAASSAAIKMPPVDFARNEALLVQMGQKPTAGYGLWPEQPVARLRGEVLEVVLDWQSPPPGAMAAQVLTSPCMLIAIPRTGYKTIRVLDAAGQVRASTPAN